MTISELVDALIEGEIVRAAAFRYKGKVFTGGDHHDAIQSMVDAGHFKSVDHFHDVNTDAEDGFVTHAGKFIDRKQAHKLAKKAGQLDKTYPNFRNDPDEVDSNMIKRDGRYKS